MYDGGKLFDNIVKFVSNNKDTISNILNVAGFIADAVGKIGTNTINVTQNKELKSKTPTITDYVIN